MQLRKVISRCEISYTGTGTVLPADKYFSIVAQLDFELIGELCFEYRHKSPPLFWRKEELALSQQELTPQLARPEKNAPNCYCVIRANSISLYGSSEK